MPVRHRFCWCLGGHKPPDISHGTENGNMIVRQIEADLPMPEEEELNALFSELVVSGHYSMLISLQTVV